MPHSQGKGLSSAIMCIMCPFAQICSFFSPRIDSPQYLMTVAVFWFSVQHVPLYTNIICFFLLVLIRLILNDRTCVPLLCTACAPLHKHDQFSFAYWFASYFMTVPVFRYFAQHVPLCTNMISFPSRIDSPHTSWPCLCSVTLHSMCPFAQTWSVFLRVLIRLILHDRASVPLLCTGCAPVQRHFVRSVPWSGSSRGALE